MDEVSTIPIPTASNLSGSEALELTDIVDLTEDDFGFGIGFDGSDGGIWSGHFVPPPPRPIFLDDNVTPDGLTTCDLCSWAWQEGKSFTLDTALEAPGELGWVLTLVIVSLISALIGAIVMIIVLHCKSRIKNTPSDESTRASSRNPRNLNRPPINTPDDKTITTISSPNFPSNPQNMANNGVWSWLSRRNTTNQSQLNSPTSPAENHYTHMDEAYSGVGEALYAELDNESTADSPAYQNSAYTDPEAPMSSAPSSAYYSDLSVTTMPERAYEVVGLSTLPTWESSDTKRQIPVLRLASISEANSVPSDYV